MFLARCVTHGGYLPSSPGSFQGYHLLESSDFMPMKNSYSFIGINAIAGIEIINAAI
jgi:hypothetical protein